MPRVTSFDERERSWRSDLAAQVGRLYEDPTAVVDRLLAVARDRHAERSDELCDLDDARLADPGWFQRPEMLGYAAYADRFAGNLRAVADRSDYLADLGVTYLHLMPLLRPGPEPNDGGYAVADFRAIRDDLGDLDDLEHLTSVLRSRGISLCLDLVLNHVASTHSWADAARSGDLEKRSWFHSYPDRTEPDRWERTLPEVFPDFAPGNFTWDDEMSRWVWTTFNGYQWDLNWANPEVLIEFADLICFLANLGVEVFRLDAIAFLWKRLGTDCQNQPEVHVITRILRTVARIACPAVIFKAEAIVGPDDLPAYLGTGEHVGRVSDLAYHNSLMVQIWSMLASQEVRLATHALQRIPPPPSSTSWVTYLRCHDDIGWAITDEDAAALGMDATAHRGFLSDWYDGAHPGSWARGLVFQANPATGDRRISGSLASLAGLECGDPGAVPRILLSHAVIMSFGGLPLLWMGDELGLLNDHSWADDPRHGGDNRWVHRPSMPWPPREDTHGVREGLEHLLSIRRSLPHLHAATPTEVWDPRDPGVLLVVRRHANGPLLAVANVTDSEGLVTGDVLAWLGLSAERLVDHLTGRPPQFRHGDVVLPAYGTAWLTANDQPVNESAPREEAGQTV